MATTNLPPGTAPIKPEYILSNVSAILPDDDAAEGSTSHLSRNKGNTGNDDGERHAGPKRKKWSKEERKNKRGANKGRRFQKVRDELELCWKIASEKPCEFGSE
ncbi:hypothetical protein EIP86_011488 [Pleurotus ostreatoroseus]|nr:hypothetical protein EIP86_011488 [Pleurotus ostreatoroseus]